MDAHIETVASSLEALRDQYCVIAHNLANANTAGYKRQATVFSEALAAKMSLSTVPVSAVVPTTTVDFTQGVLVSTGRALDVAIEGKGFLVLETPQGTLYTRNGSLKVNAQRQLVDVSGRIVAGQDGPITLPGTEGTQDLQVSSDGQVSCAGKAIGRLRIVEFQDTSELVAVGENCFQAPQAAQAQPAVGTHIRQGYQEASNVSIVEELVGLIAVSKLYEANLKSIMAEDERMKTILQVAMG